MKHRERVIAALSHQTPDRCPMQVSFTPEFADRLRAELKVTEALVHNPHGGGNTYQLERCIGEDLLLASVGWANSYYQADGSYVDEWGVGWCSQIYETAYGTGRYTEMVHHPLADESALARYRPPDPQRQELYMAAERAIREFQDEYWIVGVTVTTMFETAWALRGYERLMMDFVERPDLADAILDIPYCYHLTAAERLVQMGVDMIWIGDDVGTQRGMLFSPVLWRRFLKNRLATFVSRLKSLNPKLKVAYHSDGDITPIISELIEVGIDVLNPVQPACMNPALLKEQFGDRLCFWGTLDEQYTLPFGSPNEVREEVLSRLRNVGNGGGLILGPTHHVQLDTPMDNFWAMVETITGKQG
jgi:uroporphyrinogen decarboxylase